MTPDKTNTPDPVKLVEEIADAGASFGACSVTKMNTANARIRVDKAKAALLAEFTRLAALSPAPSPQRVQCLYCTHISDLGKGIVVYPDAAPTPSETLTAPEGGE